MKSAHTTHSRGRECIDRVRAARKVERASYQFYQHRRRRRVAIRFLLPSNAFKLFIMGLLFQSTSANGRVDGGRMAGENIIRPARINVIYWPIVDQCIYRCDAQSVKSRLR